MKKSAHHRIFVFVTILAFVACSPKAPSAKQPVHITEIVAETAALNKEALYKISVLQDSVHTLIGMMNILNEKIKLSDSLAIQKASGFKVDDSLRLKIKALETVINHQNQMIKNYQTGKIPVNKPK